MKVNTVLTLRMSQYKLLLLHQYLLSELDTPFKLLGCH